MKVAIGSKNPVKIEAVTRSFGEAFPADKIEFVSVNAPSMVSRQPMSNEETRLGATNRARHAQKTLKADYGIGLEGGLHPIDSQWYCVGWVSIVNREGICSVGSTSQLVVPRTIMKMIFEGMELGEAADNFFGVQNSKQHVFGGFSGFMTNNILNRVEEYRIAVLYSLSRFLHPEFFDHSSPIELQKPKILASGNTSATVR